MTFYFCFAENEKNCAKLGWKRKENKKTRKQETRNKKQETRIKK